MVHACRIDTATCKSKDALDQTLIAPASSFEHEPKLAGRTSRNASSTAGNGRNAEQPSTAHEPLQTVADVQNASLALQCFPAVRDIRMFAKPEHNSTAHPAAGHLPRRLRWRSAYKKDDPEVRSQSGGWDMT